MANSVGIVGKGQVIWKDLFGLTVLSRGAKGWTAKTNAKLAYANVCKDSEIALWSGVVIDIGTLKRSHRDSDCLGGWPVGGTTLLTGDFERGALSIGHVDLSSKTTTFRPCDSAGKKIALSPKMPDPIVLTEKPHLFSVVVDLDDDGNLLICWGSTLRFGHLDRERAVFEEHWNLDVHGLEQGRWMPPQLADGKVWLAAYFGSRNETVGLELNQAGKIEHVRHVSGHGPAVRRGCEVAVVSARNEVQRTSVLTGATETLTIPESFWAHPSGEPAAMSPKLDELSEPEVPSCRLLLGEDETFIVPWHAETIGILGSGDFVSRKLNRNETPYRHYTCLVRNRLTQPAEDVGCAPITVSPVAKKFKVGLRPGGPDRGRNAAQKEFVALLKAVAKETGKPQAPAAAGKVAPAAKPKKATKSAKDKDKYTKPKTRTGEIARLGVRLGLWLRTFAKREDLTFHSCDISPGVKPKPEVRAFSTALAGLVKGINGYKLSWSFPGDPEHQDSAFFGVREDGGVTTQAYEENTYPFYEESVDSIDYAKEVSDYLTLDVASAEVVFYLVKLESGPNPKPGRVVCCDANCNVVAGVGELDEYMEKAVRSAFVYYWHAPTSDTRAALKKLRSMSAPLKKIAEKRAALMAKGLTESEAEELIDWLGGSVRLLVEAGFKH